MFLEEDVCIIGPASDPQLQREIAPVALLGNRKLILTGLRQMGIRLALEQAAAQAGITLDVMLEVESMNVAKSLGALATAGRFIWRLPCNLKSGKGASLPFHWKG